MQFITRWRSDNDEYLATHDRPEGLATVVRPPWRAARHFVQRWQPLPAQVAALPVPPVTGRRAVQGQERIVTLGDGVHANQRRRKEGKQ